MRRLFAFLVLLTATATAVRADGWQVDPERALESARTLKRPVLAAVLGTSWDHVSAKMREEVLDTEAFSEWASGRLVLLEIDVPADRGNLHDSDDAHTRFLREHSIRAFPTFLILDHKGRELRRAKGYIKGGLDGFRDWAAPAL